MRKLEVRTFLLTALLFGAAAETVHADVCVTIDDAHDTFSAGERHAALLLLTRQFELEGERVVAGACAMPFTISHVVLGNTITVTIVGADGRRQATALGLDDLPAVYSQMVRSIVTGRPMSGWNVVDRTNVTRKQSEVTRVNSDSVGYARLGYGATFGDRVYGGPAVGFGYRVELDSVAVDVSFFNFQVNSEYNAGSYGYSSSRSASTGTLLKLQMLRFLNGTGNHSVYAGGGLGWGGTSLSHGGSTWNGSGLEADVTAGYEIARATTMRFFAQADASFPFYKVASNYTYNRYCTACGFSPIRNTQYTPSVVLSLGIGWQRGRHN